MVNPKPTLIAILITALAASTVTANSYDGCAILDNAGRCRECFERKVLPNGQGCGPQQPSSDKCLLYTIDNTKRTSNCLLCKTGSASKVVRNGPRTSQSCVPATFSNCLLEIDLTVGTYTSKECVACPGGQYSVPNVAKRTSTCQQISNPVPNCKWGSTYSPQIKQARCIRCDDGYAVDFNTRQCAPTGETGCWIQNAGKCIACNPFEGYSVNSRGQCFKTGASVGFEDTHSVKDVLTALGMGGF